MRPWQTSSLLHALFWSDWNLLANLSWSISKWSRWSFVDTKVESFLDTKGEILPTDNQFKKINPIRQTYATTRSQRERDVMPMPLPLSPLLKSVLLFGSYYYALFAICEHIGILITCFNGGDAVPGCLYLYYNQTMNIWNNEAWTRHASMPKEFESVKQWEIWFPCHSQWETAKFSPPALLLVQKLLPANRLWSISSTLSTSNNYLSWIEHSQDINICFQRPDQTST